MCNRYSKAEERIKLETRFARIILFEWSKRFNIAPTQNAPIALMRDGKVEGVELRWGIEGHAGPVTNARSETAHEKRMFRDAWKNQHCLVAADGFYEWKDTPEGKQPYRFVLRSREPFWFAGLHDGNAFTILTAPSRGCVTPLHDREPIILRPDTLESWLQNEPWTPADVSDRRMSAELLECYPVTKAMSNARNAGPDCIEPITIPQQEWQF
jgi:putative SOS response-associated peptidase YedK